MSLDSENQADEEVSRLYHQAKLRIHYAAKEGHAMTLITHIKGIPNEEIRNEIVNEVSNCLFNNLEFKISFEVVV